MISHPMFHYAAAICIGSAAAAFAPAAQPVDPNRLKPGEPLAVEVETGGRATVDLPGGRYGRSHLVVIGLAKPGDQAVDVRATVATVDRASPIAPADRSPNPAWLTRTSAAHDRMAEKRLMRRQPATEHVAAKFPEQKSFHVFVQDNDLRDASGYHEVRAKLAAVGRHCLVYVDLDDKPEEFSKTVLDDIVSTFDQRVYPTSGTLFGRHVDVDRNGKFTILVTHWLNQLSGGKVSLGGFVRGGDFYRDVSAPFSNQCDMMYLNSKLHRGSHLQNIIAHEYTHAITFCEHVFGDYLPGRGGEDEESWLNEAISHLAENLMGTGWSNLDYRISAFLNAPQAYRLIVPDYYRAGLWRCPGSRGSTFLFLRYCVDRFGIELLQRLTQSNLNGVANIEQATRMPFDELFRDWSIWVASAGLAADPAKRASADPAIRLSADGPRGVRQVALVGKLGRRLLAGPRFADLTPGEHELRLMPSSFLPLRLETPPGQTLRLELEASGALGMQVTMIRLPDDLPQAALEVTTAPPTSGDPRDRRAAVTVRHLSGEPVRWLSLSWESLSDPSTRTPEITRGAEVVDAAEVFANPATKRNQTLLSDPLDFSGIGPGRAVLKLTGADRRGRKISAWAEFAR